jgi:hypothetical protein
MSVAVRFETKRKILSEFEKLGLTQWRTEGGWGFTPLPLKFRSFDKAEPNSQFRGKYIPNNPQYPESLTKSNRIAN